MTRKEQKVATRALVMDAARRQFTERGYMRASMRGIIKDTGLSTGALYDNFDNKAALWVETMNCSPPDPMEMVRMIARMEEATDPCDAIDTVNSLRRWAAQIEKYAGG